MTKLRERGKVAHSAVQNLGARAKTADHWVRKYVRGSAWTGCWWRGRAVRHGLVNHDVRFLLVGDFRQLSAVRDTWAGTPVNKPLRHSQLMLAAGGTS